jgi:hypothetical protein
MTTRQEFSTAFSMQPEPWMVLRLEACAAGVPNPAHTTKIMRATRVFVTGGVLRDWMVVVSDSV